MDIPTKEENRFIKYLEEYLVKLEKENPNIKIGKIDLPGFTVFGIHESIIISKKFGFIKRLLDNDKIDFNKIPNEIEEIGIPMLRQGEIKYGFDSSDYYWLLMLLSIQDNPIEFLVSILK